jgi:hypothetical protein
MTIRQLDAISIIYKRVNSLDLVSTALGISDTTLRKLLVKNGVVLNSTHPKYKKFSFQLREEIKNDIKKQIEYNKQINYKNLFNDTFIEWLDDKYETKFKRTYLYNLKKEIKNNKL